MEEEDQAKVEPIKLLLVDDEKGFVDVLANRLARRQIDVVKAYSGAEAIQILRRQDFDVAVLDLKMEDIDGIEVLKIFKKMLIREPPSGSGRMWTTLPSAGDTATSPPGSTRSGSRKKFAQNTASTKSGIAQSQPNTKPIRSPAAVNPTP